jgi:HAMP domain-containing protein
MSHWLHFVFCALFIAILTLIIWIWNRGAQRRRFNKTFPLEADPFWTTKDATFLAAIEEAYALPFGWAKRLPHQSTPMGLYLVLYPEHCIYDDCENERFLSTLKFHLKLKMPKEAEALTQTFETLAAYWQEAENSQA